MADEWEYAPLNEKTITDLFTVETSGAKGFINKYSLKFLEEAPGYLEAIKAGVEKCNYSGVAAAVHKLNGLGSTFGAIELREECITLEESAKDENFADCESTVEKIIDELQKVSAAIERLSKR